MSVYMPLDCDGFAAALADYLEGDAPDAVRAAVEAHAEDCADCSALLADLRAIRAHAAALPALAPSRDLWSGIAERIDVRVLPLQRTGDANHRSGAPFLGAAGGRRGGAGRVTAGITHFATRARYAGSTAASLCAHREELSTRVRHQRRAAVAIITPSAHRRRAKRGSTTGQPGAQRAESTPPLVATTPQASGRAAAERHSARRRRRRDERDRAPATTARSRSSAPS